MNKETTAMPFIELSDTHRFTLDREKLRAHLISRISLSGPNDHALPDPDRIALAFASFFAIANEAGAIIGPKGLDAEVHAIEEHRSEPRLLATVRERRGVPLRQVASYPIGAETFDRQDAETFDGACRVLDAILAWINLLIPTFRDLLAGERIRSRRSRDRIPPDRSQLAARLDACGWPGVADDVRDGVGLDIILLRLREQHPEDVASATALVDGRRIRLAAEVPTDHEACMIARRWFNAYEREDNILAQLAHDGQVVDPVRLRAAIYEGMPETMAGAPGFPTTPEDCAAERAALEAYLATRTDFGPVDGWA
jgi:hypothetical protein